MGLGWCWVLLLSAQFAGAVTVYSDACQGVFDPKIYQRNPSHWFEELVRDGDHYSGEGGYQFYSRELEKVPARGYWGRFKQGFLGIYSPRYELEESSTGIQLQLDKHGLSYRLPSGWGEWSEPESFVSFLTMNPKAPVTMRAFRKYFRGTLLPKIASELNGKILARFRMDLAALKRDPRFRTWDVIPIDSGELIDGHPARIGYHFSGYLNDGNERMKDRREFFHGDLILFPLRIASSKSVTFFNAPASAKEGENPLAPLRDCGWGRTGRYDPDLFLPARAGDARSLLKVYQKDDESVDPDRILKMLYLYPGEVRDAYSDFQFTGRYWSNELQAWVKVLHQPATFHYDTDAQEFTRPTTVEILSESRDQTTGPIGSTAVVNAARLIPHWAP